MFYKLRPRNDFGIFLLVSNVCRSQKESMHVGEFFKTIFLPFILVTIKYSVQYSVSYCNKSGHNYVRICNPFSNGCLQVFPENNPRSL